MGGRIEALFGGIPYVGPALQTGKALKEIELGPVGCATLPAPPAVTRFSMTLPNGRHFVGRLSLEEQGFVLVEHKTQVTDFFAPAQLTEVYYREVEQLIKSLSALRAW
jgi:hypothetical protein